MGTDTAALWKGLRAAGAERFETFEEFRAQYNGPYIPWIDAAWAPKVFATFKENPNTYVDRPLLLPKARKLADVIDGALMAPLTVIPNGGGSEARVPNGYVFFSTLRSKFDLNTRHLGGKHGWRVLRPPSREVVLSISGNWHGIYVQPCAEIWAEYGGWPLEAVTREDGHLIIANAPGGIFSYWIALLHLDCGSLRAMIPQEQRDAYEADERAEAERDAKLVCKEGRWYLPEEAV